MKAGLGSPSGLIDDSITLNGTTYEAKRYEEHGGKTTFIAIPQGNMEINHERVYLANGDYLDGLSLIVDTLKITK